jgi:alanyl-tRNA synthetase
MLVADGVLPGNEGRGYVLRRIIRRAVLTARRMGVETSVTPQLAETVAEVMGGSYPELPARLHLVQGVLDREESGFDRTLRTGMGLLTEALDAARTAGRGSLAGDVAFRLHDTHGFPIELTEELAAESGSSVDRTGFEAAMAEQRDRARSAAKAPAAADEASYRGLLDGHGPTEFVGQSPADYAVSARVLAILAGAEPGTAEIFLDRTPFYAEGGGQVGDVGSIVTETGRAEVRGTAAALPGLAAHRARVSGEIFAGQEALATIDGPRREAVRRNHTGTHLLHAALREVLGDHVRQQGSLVAPDRLRFDFSHHAQPRREELAAVAAMANADILGDDRVETTVTSRAEAEEMGAVAFFGDKYGDVVRVVRAGPRSLELCGGTHVHALGQIGPIEIVSEGSIGSNTRRIESVTGSAALDRSARREVLVHRAAEVMKAEPDDLVDALERLLERQRATERELARLKGASIGHEAADLAADAASGAVVARRDGLAADDLRALAQAVRRHDGVRAVLLGGTPDGTKVALVAVTDGTPDAAELVKQVASLVGGGGGGSAEVAVAGGRDLSGLAAALDQGRKALGVP